MLELGGNDPINASLTNLALRDILAAALTTGQILDASVLRLYQSGPAPNSNMTLADFTLASFSGYADVTGVGFGAPSWEGGKAAIASVSALNRFAGTDGTTIQTITGYMLTDDDTSTANILYAEKLDTPVELGAANSELTVIPVIKLAPRQ